MSRARAGIFVSLIVDGFICLDALICAEKLYLQFRLYLHKLLNVTYKYYMANLALYIIEYLQCSETNLKEVREGR